MPTRFLIIATIAAIGCLPAALHAHGIIKGRVIFDGTPPAVEKVEVKSDVSTCGTVKEVRKLILGADKGVANAVVKIVGAAGNLTPKDGRLDQVNCEFVPHVQVVPTGSLLVITSSDPVLHNSHGFNEDGSTAFNIAVPIAGLELTTKLAKPGIIKLRCDAGHTWMSAYVIVTNVPICTVTDPDGNFSLSGIRAGTYEIEVWHEWLGNLHQSISVKEGEQAVTLIMKQP